MAKSEHWKKEPDDHDYPAARAYLSLVMTETEADSAVDALRKAPLTTGKAKDILRASQLPLLPADNFHVAADLKKVKKQERLSPVLLLRGSLSGNPALVIADGYHRVCASYHLDENADIPCRLVDPPS
jgi:hypothetical protein